MPNKYRSNVENILRATIDGTEDYNKPLSNVEKLLVELKGVIESGGSSTLYATALSLTIDSSTYVVTAQLLNKDRKSWLAAQYTAGTPVIVYYVLATPEAGAVNEPLMKIGDYADTLSNAVSIPTTDGANSITVDTTVQPSEFTATWTGWHNATVKEWDGQNWT